MQSTMDAVLRPKLLGAAAAQLFSKRTIPCLAVHDVSFRPTRCLREAYKAGFIRGFSGV